MKSISIQSPTRVDLAGGTLDMWPLYCLTKSASTINVAIDIMTMAQIQPLDSKKIVLHSKDLQLQSEYADLDACLSDQDPRLSLLQAQMHFWKPKQGFVLTCSSQSPVGGGLGGSSSLTISLLKAFSQFCEQKFSSVHQMVHVAHNIEAQVLSTPTGTQDYYPAVSGGLNILDYGTQEIQQTVLPVISSGLSDYFLLAYTGKAHHSGLNNFEVLTKAVQKNEKTLKALHEIRRIAEETRSVCLDKKWNQLPGLFRQEFAARVQLAEAFSSPEIEKLSEVAMKAGALAVKICGAGGGGCVLLWVEPQHKMKVTEQCQKEGFQILSAQPVDPLQ